MSEAKFNDPSGEWVDIPDNFTNTPYSGKLPPRLYRYRSYTENNWRDRLGSEIGQTKVFLSPAGSLNDPEEVLPEVRLVGEVDDIRTYWRGQSASFVPAPRSRKEMEDEIERLTQLTLENHCSFTDSMYRDYIGRMASRARIACFSEHENNPVMWAHYGVYRTTSGAHAHGGIVLQYSVVDELRKANLHPVSYQTQRPTIDLLNKHAELERSVLAAFTTKDVAWSYESEWRFYAMVEDMPADGNLHPHFLPLQLSSHLLTGIYFGLHTPQHMRDEVVRLIAAKEQPPRLYEVYRDRHTLGLNRREVVRTSQTSFDLQPVSTGRVFL